jgi:thermostable 8-oxoguanine DNA glycosylase
LSSSEKKHSKSDRFNKKRKQTDASDFKSKSKDFKSKSRDSHHDKKIREVEFCIVATVQTQFLAGAVVNSHQHCMQYSSYKGITI